jgi:hypothetical protein
MKSYLVPTILALLLAVPGALAQGNARRVTWTEFQKEAARLRLNGRNVTVAMQDGDTIRCLVKMVREDGLVVEPNRHTRQWARANGEHRIPKEEIATVSSKERVGHKCLLGGLIGLGATAAAAAAVAVSATPGERGYGAAGALALIPVGGIGGYYLGHSRDQPIPVYIIVPDPPAVD